MGLQDVAALDEQRRLQQIADAWAAYGGDHPQALKPQTDGKQVIADDNVPLNFCRVIVNKGVSFLFGQPPNFDLPDLDDGKVEKLNEVLTANVAPLLWKQFAMNGAVTGMAYIRIFDTGPNRPVRLVNLDPANVFVAYEPDDYQDVYLYRLQWNGLDEDGEASVYRTLIRRADNRATWTITDQIAKKREATQETDFVDRREPYIWPYPFAPIVEAQNLPVPNEYWGEPDLTKDIIDLNYALESIMANGRKIVRRFAHPRPWAKGVSADDEALDDDPDELWILPQQADLGALKFDADLKSSIDLYSQLKQALHELARIPEVATGKLENVGNLSGVALQILFQPIIEKTEDKQGTYGHALRELIRRVLVVGKIVTSYDDAKAVVVWPEILPEDTLAERQTALIDHQLGVSKKTILERLGYDPDAEIKAKAEEEEALGERLLDEFGRGPGNPDEGGTDSGT